jgi:hypothetical protein
MKVGQNLAIVTHANDGHVGTLKNDTWRAQGEPLMDWSHWSSTVRSFNSHLWHCVTGSWVALARGRGNVSTDRLEEFTLIRKAALDMAGPEYVWCFPYRLENKLSAFLTCEEILCASKFNLPFLQKNRSCSATKIVGVIIEITSRRISAHVDHTGGWIWKGHILVREPTSNSSSKHRRLNNSTSCSPWPVYRDRIKKSRSYVTADVDSITTTISTGRASLYESDPLEIKLADSLADSWPSFLNGSFYFLFGYRLGRFFGISKIKGTAGLIKFPESNNWIHIKISTVGARRWLMITCTMRNYLILQHEPVVANIE